MFRNYVTVALRNLGRYKGYAFIKIAGLAVGMAVSLLIFLFVKNELDYDRHHRNLERIYRLELGGRFAVLPPAVAPAVATHIPEIQKAVRLTDGERVAVRYRDRTLSVSDVVWADEDVLDIFSFTFLHGNPESALDAPYSIVVTESVARSIFGETYPIGQTIRGNDAFDVTVTGVIQDVESFHIPVNALGSFSTLEESIGRRHFDEEYEDDWAYATYVLLPESHDKTAVQGKINDFFRENEIFRDPETHLQPLKGLYFLESGKLGEGYRKQGNIQLVYMLVAIAVAVLLVASINTVNLSTATATYRAKEVGVRKALGASRSSLILQFLVESVLIAAASFLFALALVELLLPEFNTLVASRLTLRPLYQPLTLLSIVIGVPVVGFGAGLYPAFYLSSLRPATILKGDKTKGRRAAFFRTVLIVYQYAVSILLIVGTLTVFDQLEYMKRVDLGFEKEQVMVSAMSRELQGKKDVFKQRLLRHPGISDVSFSCRVPGESHWSWGVEIGGVADQVYVNSVEPGYLELMGVELTAGRALSSERVSDRKTKFVVNEAAVRFFDLTSPIGAAVLDGPNGRGEIIGVVKDFHFESLHHRISPLLFYWEDRALRRVSIKVSAENIPDAVDHVKETWMELLPAFPFEFSFLDEAFDRQYRAEERLTKIFGYFAALAVVIASVGLLGLSSFLTLRRTKEIGVRKVLGATVPGIVGLLSSQYLRWVLLANLIAWPVAYVALGYWLEGFAYRTEMTAWSFVLAALTALIVAFGTVVTQSLRAARANPVDSLRYE